MLYSTFSVDRVLVIAVVNITIISVGNRTTQEQARMSTSKMCEIIAKQILDFAKHMGYRTPAMNRNNEPVQRLDAMTRFIGGLDHYLIRKLQQ